ncbi:TPA: DNA-binding protein, partial [Streptococcus suis]
LYDVNVKNVRSLAFYLDDNFKQDSLIKQPITTVRKFDKLFSYIEKNIDRFVTEFIPYMSDNLCDKWLDMYYLLNHNEVTSDNRIEYLKRVQNNILDFEQLDDAIIKDAAIAFNKARFSTKNILDYFCEYHSWNDRLIEFVNNGEHLDFLQTEFKGFSDEFQEEFFEETVKCNQLANDKYKEILSKLGWCFTEFKLANIADEKMSILISTRSISDKFSVNTLNFLRDNYQNHVIEYLIEYIEGYLLENEGDTDVYHETEMFNLLQEGLTDERKFKIIDRFPTRISIEGKDYSTPLVNHILQNKFD